MWFLTLILVAFLLLVLSVIAGCLIGAMIDGPDDDEYPYFD